MAVAKVRREGGMAGELGDGGAPFDHLSEGDLRTLVAMAAAILWPTGDPDAPWNPSTVDDVARVFTEAGLRPDGRRG